MRRLRPLMTAVLLSAYLVAPSAGQTNTLRGLSDSTPNRLPSAQQQLNQNLNRQQSDFSTRQQIDSSNRLNRTDQINRLNTQPRSSDSPCAGANESCREAEE
ncbi:hypothetical protein [Roseibium sp. Sym1]|uniref:hypothetical protein n=1 Tax=Roseibium sp. Sym1 TaxID=3016006 RepID=UPI0022B59D41|nr:hypothetical protein [Roseibium sp. Sym1]